MRSKNKIVSLLLCACMFLTLIPSPAAAAVGGEFVDAGSGLRFKVLTEDAGSATGTVQVMQDSYGATAYSIPEMVYQDGINYAVTGIGYSAFSGCSGLNSVNIPDGVTDIGNFAFQGCGSLTSINIPDGVAGIGISAFSGTGLSSITVPAGVHDVWDYAFSQCANLTAVAFLGIAPPTIGGQVFTGAAVQTVTVPAGAQAAYGFVLSGKLPAGASIVPAAATITGVSVSPPAAEVVRGGTMTFSATVNGSGSFSQAVTWSVESSYGGTFIDSDGVLTVATGEYAPTLTVKATSLADQNVYGEATVTVKSNEPQEQFSLPAGSTCYFDLSGAAGGVGEINDALPDASLKWVPFTYVGTVNAYSLDASASGSTTASETAAAAAGGRSLFLADHNVYLNVSWDDLNAAGLIFGSSYTANGVPCLLRSLSAGSGRDGSLTTPVSNEWDQILIKGNFIYNYSGNISWGQDTSNTQATRRIIRGYYSSYYWEPISSSFKYPAFGFRPALEIRNADTLSPGALKTVTYDMGANGTLGSGSLTSAPVVYAGELTLPEITETNGFHYTGAPQSGEVPGWYYGSAFHQAGTKLSSLPGGAVLTAGYGVPPRNNPPGRRDGIGETTTASVAVNTAYALNLAAIFADADGDPLTYRVSVNGADEIIADADYSYTPASTGATTLVFRAYDGTAYSAGTYTVTLTAGPAGSVPITAPDVTVAADGSNKNLAITGGTPLAVTVNIPGGISDATVSAASLLNAPAGGMVTAGPLPALTINSTLQGISGGPVQVSIPAGSTISAPDTWDGTINLPQVVSNPTVTVGGYTTTVGAAIELGAGNIALTFSQPVRILLAGQGGKNAGWIRNGSFTPITYQMAADSAAALNGHADGYITVSNGSDLAVWTTHLTTFVAYTQAANNGGGGGGGGGTPALALATASLAAGAAGQPYSQAVATNGGGTAPYTFTVTGGSLPRGLTLDASTGVIGGTPEAAGTYTFTVTVKDANSKSANKAYTMTVNAADITPSPSKPVTFTDVAGHWAERNIEKLVEMGAVNGYPDGTFKPDAGITRAQLTAMLVKAFKLQGKGDRVFADTAGHWAREVIAAAASSGIIGGYDQNTFGPDDPVTREQMAVMTVKAAKLSQASGETAFTDREKISPWARESVNTAVRAGIIAGYSDSTFRPGGKATRAEAVTVIVNALK